MPEIAEVETVRNTLKLKILHHKIKDIRAYYPKILLDPLEDVQKALIGSEFIDIQRRGKWLMFETKDYYLLSHLRMEGKFFLKQEKDPLEKHEHIEFVFDDFVMRYHDTRKFGRMKLVLKDKLMDFEGISKLGPEVLSDEFNGDDLYRKIHSKNIPIKTLLLDQTIVAGLGNIYTNEVLFLSHINPHKMGQDLTKKECDAICVSSKEIIAKAIQMGGTTIRSYTSSLGVTGRFQQYLMVHGKENEPCPICKMPIIKEFIGGRSTYYCKKCQKK